MNQIKNKEEFNEVIKKDKVVIDFYADWCGPCKMLSPILEEVAREEQVDIWKVNVDEQEELAREYGIMSIPTVIVFKQGEKTNKNVGYMDKEELLELMK